MKPMRADLLLVASILLAAALLAVVWYAATPRGRVAVVTVAGEEYARLDLTTDTTLSVEGTHTVVVENGKVRVVAAPCPDQICVHHAPISRIGETIVCLPAQVIVTVEEGGT